MSKTRSCYCLYALLWSPLANQENAVVAPAVLIFVKLQDKHSMLFFPCRMRGKNIADSKWRGWLLKGTLSILMSKWLQIKIDRWQFCSFPRRRTHTTVRLLLYEQNSLMTDIRLWVTFIAALSSSCLPRLSLALCGSQVDLSPAPLGIQCLIAHCSCVLQVFVQSAFPQRTVFFTSKRMK